MALFYYDRKIADFILDNKLNCDLLLVWQDKFPKKVKRAKDNSMCEEIILDRVELLQKQNSYKLTVLIDDNTPIRNCTIKERDLVKFTEIKTDGEYDKDTYEAVGVTISDYKMTEEDDSFYEDEVERHKQLLEIGAKECVEFMTMGQEEFYILIDSQRIEANGNTPFECDYALIQPYRDGDTEKLEKFVMFGDPNHSDTDKIDWDTKRIELCKDILCSLLQSDEVDWESDIAYLINTTIRIASGLELKLRSGFTIRDYINRIPRKLI